MKVKVSVIAVASRKELHQVIRRPLQRRLRDWATVILYSTPQNIRNMASD